jgi:F420H(2)-dependent quinone reductase
MPSAAKITQKMLTKVHSLVYRVTGGRVAGRAFKSPVLLLTTTGRKSGRERTTPLLYLEDGENLVVVASYGGAPNHPSWWLNLKANPEATVEIGDRKVRVRAEQAHPEEKERLWPKLVAMYGSYEDYQKRTEREIPVGILRPIDRSRRD